MARRQPSWRSIADLLASRLMHHAWCEQHADPEEDQDCPFCDDIRAYIAYLERGGTSRIAPLPADAVFVRIEDIKVTMDDPDA